MTKTRTFTKVVTTVRCSTCGTDTEIQASLGGLLELDPGAVPFPENSLLPCPGCSTAMNLSRMKAEMEAEKGLPLVFERGTPGPKAGVPWGPN